jgi:PHD/YefM family antitoxin component YafN of YafNO toxin-antitoxin module
MKKRQFMLNISAQKLDQYIIKALNILGKEKEESILINLNGKKFVIIREEDFKSWNETSFLFSSKKNAEILKKSLKEPIDKCRDLDDIYDK